MSNTSSACIDLWHLIFCTKLHLKLVQITDSKMVQFRWDGDAGFWVWSSLGRSYRVLASQFVTIGSFSLVCKFWNNEFEVWVVYCLDIGWTHLKGKVHPLELFVGLREYESHLHEQIIPYFGMWSNGIIFKIKEMIRYFDISLAQSHSRLVIDNLKFTKYILTDKVIQLPSSIWSNLQNKIVWYIYLWQPNLALFFVLCSVRGG